ncbi:penicillin-binding protein 2 [Candidatus Dependentiae bacterium]|nr:penicillin-binding protein 2 [Candidatus Dependentiae bacterium]
MKEHFLQGRNNKIIKILFIFFIFILVFIFRLVYLQVKNNNKFTNLGKKNFLRTRIIPPLRGNIVDCNGYLLASNKPVYNLYWIGYGDRRITKDQKDTLKKLESILKINLIDDKIGTIRFANIYSKKVLLKKDLNFNQLCLISEQCSASCNIKIQSDFLRIYPYKKLASHILGYLSKKIEDYTTKGLSGLEKMFQEQLKGQTGYALNVINSKGSKIDQLEFCQPKKGSDLKLTIDLNLQYIAENIFEKGQAGAFILMDPKDGSIRSLVSFPGFDPNALLRPISKEEWENKFVCNNVFLNRITSAVYPPASIFKLITFAAGLEEKVIEADTQFMCKGFLNFHGRRYHCIRHWGHGKLDSKVALAYSCNIPCLEIAQELKINELADYAYRFGLGKKTGFLLPEKSGLVPTYEWKVATKGQRWWKGETLSVAIGQSYTLVTPLQMVRMIASICSGYLVKPRILQQEEIKTSDLQISEKTLKFLRNAMHGVVKQGSAKILSRIEGFEVFAKTGTAQTSSLTVEKKSKRHLEHAWLAAYFKYKQEDPLALVVLVEHVGSSKPAREIAYKFLRNYKNFREYTA